MVAPKNPMVGSLAACCARAASGHAAAAPPSRLTNSRRLMTDIGAPSHGCRRRSYQLGTAGRRRFDASGACRGKGQPVLGADLNCSKSVCRAMPLRNPPVRPGSLGGQTIAAADQHAADPLARSTPHAQAAPHSASTMRPSPHAGSHTVSPRSSTCSARAAITQCGRWVQIALDPRVAGLVLTHGARAKHFENWR